ncbi:uncharacterized protein isoform X2 [Rhodnius prolixus]|uniref:uncharacterized protein isoform X2 n=1 Tax=Rhodnius prolixus TaxID=13249 RepID=UPI003D189EA8
MQPATRRIFSLQWTHIIGVDLSPFSARVCTRISEIYDTKLGEEDQPCGGYSLLWLQSGKLFS